MSGPSDHENRGRGRREKKKNSRFLNESSDDEQADKPTAKRRKVSGKEQEGDGDVNACPEPSLKERLDALMKNMKPDPKSKHSNKGPVYRLISSARKTSKRSGTSDDIRKSLFVIHTFGMVCSL